MKNCTPKWTFDDKELDEVPKNAAGFVYLIIDNETGMKYIGKKSFWSRRKLKPSDKRRTTVESDWKSYWSSSKRIKELIKEHGVERFSRKILAICDSDKYTNYLEVKFQFMFNILEEPSMWYNDNINGAWYPHNYQTIKDEVRYSKEIPK